MESGWRNFFLEQKLFEHFKIIDELELTFRNLKVLPISSPKQPRKQLFFEKYVNLKKGKLFYGLNLLIFLTYKKLTNNFVYN